MSNLIRDERLGPILKELMGLANVEPKGVFVNSAVMVPVPVASGSKIVFGALNGGNLDVLLQAELIRRIGMGSYRVFFGIVPEDRPAVATVGGEGNA